MEQKDWEKKQKISEAKTNSIILGAVLKECVSTWDKKNLVKEEEIEKAREIFKKQVKELYKIYKEIYKEIKDEGENI